MLNNKSNKSTITALSILAVLGLAYPYSVCHSAETPWANAPTWTKESGRSGGTHSSVEGRSGVARDARALSPFSPGSNNVALDIGQVFLMGDLADNYQDNIGWRAHYTYGVSDLFGFDTSLGYSSHADGKLSMASLLAGLRTNLTWIDRVIPYLVFGLGFYRPSYAVNDQGQNVSIAPILFGLHIGPGIDLQVSQNVYFGTSLTFHDMFGTRRTLASGRVEEIGGTFTSFLLHAGFTF